MISLFTLKRYLRYLLLSGHRNGHGIHSPFAFELVSVIFRNKTDDDFVCMIEKLRKKLISAREIIEVNDLGAGSVIMKKRKRKVSDIARYSSVPKKYGLLLRNMSKSFGKPYILEFGTSLGISALYLASAGRDIPVITMEGCSSTASVASGSFTETRSDNIKLMTGSFDHLLPGILNDRGSPGMVYIDGDHRKSSILRYFKRVAEVSGKNTVVIIDDINYSEEMAEAWDEIRAHEKVTMTIDIFRMGIAFFREGLSRHDYVIRY